MPLSSFGVTEGALSTDLLLATRLDLITEHTKLARSICFRGLARPVNRVLRTRFRRLRSQYWTGQLRYEKL